MLCRSPSPSKRAAAWLALLLAAIVIALPGGVSAQPAPAAPPAPAANVPPESWAGQLEILSKWLEQQKRARCTERCFTLDRLRLTGTVGEGALGFELSGGVLADGPVAVPLFGPPAHVRLSGVTLDGRDAVIGFEGDHYFLFTAAKRFVLKGSLTLDGDLALVIPGPLNSLEAELSGGAVVEGARLSGLSAATIHLSREGGGAQAAGPTVFQLSRAVRVGREIGFEYRLVMRSGTDLGVVRLPLPFGEKVLDVTGSTGWRVEGAELVLPTSGRIAEMVVTGTLQGVANFTPDARSGYEWWLLESDPEHRISVKGDGRQVDSAESPIPRTQTTSRLFLVQKGQHIEVSVQPLQSVEVLAAVVRGHTRRIVLTQRGDLVCDDQLSYENNGIDYLTYTPNGRPIYLATDGKAERIMHQGKGNDVLVPLRLGSHVVRVQSLADASIPSLGGRIELPAPSYPLTASHVALLVGVPARVIPLALAGGDRTWFWLSSGDAVAMLFALVAAWIAVRPAPSATRGGARFLKLLGGAVLGGLWFASPGLYVATLAALATAGMVWIIGRLFRGPARVGVTVMLLGGASLFALVAIFSLGTSRSPSRPSDYGSSDMDQRPATAASPAPAGGSKVAKDRLGNAFGGGSEAGVLEGVTPVALELPAAARTIDVRRELVTRDRPLRPVLYFVTPWALLPLGLAWLAAAIVVGRSQRDRFVALYEKIRDRLTREPDPPKPAEPAKGESPKAESVKSESPKAEAAPAKGEAAPAKGEACKAEAGAAKAEKQGDPGKAADPAKPADPGKGDPGKPRGGA